METAGIAPRDAAARLPVPAEADHPATPLLTAAVVLLALVALSRVPFVDARVAYFVIPIAVAFRFRPTATAVVATATLAASLVHARLDGVAGLAEAGSLLAGQDGYLAVCAAACVLLSGLLTHQRDSVARFAQVRAWLLSDVLSAEQRERRCLAEALHDNALQNLLAARHELEEVAERVEHPALARAESALSETVNQLRGAVFELHPRVLAEAGLAVALRSTAESAAERAGLELELDLRYEHRHPLEQLLFSVGRELLTNVARHAQASRVAVRLVTGADDVALVVEDDGVGFDPDALSGRLANGHVGLASQRGRVEAAGGVLTLSTAPGRGTTALVRLPRANPLRSGRSDDRACRRLPQENP